MPFREAFDCLWCGRAERARDHEDLGGWAQLCPDCLGKAGDNGFLRARLKAALNERSRAAAPATSTPATAAPAEPPATLAAGAPSPAAPTPASTDDRRRLIDYYEARAPEYDDWYLRRGRYERGPIHDAAWNAELDAAGRWLDALPIAGEIVELAAGTGWWSPLLASKGELSCYDAAGAPLDLARDRLLAHGLRAHLHVRDAWAEPDHAVDALFAGFWLSHVPRPELAAFLALARRWLKPGGVVAFIDSLEDAQSGAADHAKPLDGRATRRLADGREFDIVKVFYGADELAQALRGAGFGSVAVSTTGRFFVTGSATA